MTQSWKRMPDWFTGWFSEHHCDALHRHVTDEGIRMPSGQDDRIAFLECCSAYMHTIGLDTWVQQDGLWIRLDLSDPKWTWIALKRS